MTYAIIKVAGKQYRVREGERLLVDRLHEDDGATFAPTVLLVGGDGAPQLDPGDGTVTARVLGEAKGPKIRIGKYKKRTGYRQHTGFRASLTQIQIESIGGAPARARSKPKAESKAKPSEEPVAEAAAAPAGDLPAGYRGHDDRRHQGRGRRVERDGDRCGARPRARARQAERSSRCARGGAGAPRR